eukprot:m.65044 g.65044  ORF g.65044 m.65044 type:complete len:74 (+) comp19603_c0_seq1:125-346(+)
MGNHFHIHIFQSLRHEIGYSVVNEKPPHFICHPLLLSPPPSSRPLSLAPQVTANNNYNNFSSFVCPVATKFFR